MTPDLMVIGELFLLRFGLPLLVVAGGGYLLTRYVERRRQASSGQKDLDRKAEEKLKEIERRRHRVA